MKSVSGSKFSPIPKAMLEMMASLKIKKAQSAEDKNEETKTNSLNMQGLKAQNMQQPNPLKRKNLPDIHFIQEQLQSPNDTLMASLEDKASQGI